MVPSNSQDWQTEYAGASHLFPMPETTNYSFISVLLFYGNRSFVWVQSSPPKTTFSHFPCSSLVVCDYVLAKEMARKERSLSSFHLTLVGMQMWWQELEQSFWTTWRKLRIGEGRMTSLKAGVHLTRLSHQSSLNYLVGCLHVGQINFYSVEASVFGDFFVPAAELT